MPDPSAFVLLDDPAWLNESGLVEKLMARHPGVPVTAPAGENARGAALVHIDGVPLAIFRVAAPLPDGWQRLANNAAMHWPQAEAAFRRHKAHIRVSQFGDGPSRLHAARIVTAVVGALVADVPACSGVLWDLTVANSSQVAEEFSRAAFAPYPDFPSALWVSMHPSRDADSRVVVVTQGLTNFIGRELELDAPATQFKSLLIAARGLVTYLVQDGITVRDGDTVGASADERIPVRLMQSNRFQGWSVIAASLPTAR